MLEDLNNSQSSKQTETSLIKQVVSPYLSEVYYQLLVQNGQKNKGYLTTNIFKHYLQLPELLSNRLIDIINKNGDQRIDHNEFVSFFLKLMVGTPKQKLHIVFQCYDFDNEGYLSPENVTLLLKHIPYLHTTKYGLSSPNQDENNIQLLNDAKITNFNLQRRIESDDAEINLFVDCIFKSFQSILYFDEFVYITEKFTSELFYCVIDQFYQNIPCMQNFFILRSHFYAINNFVQLKLQPLQEQRRQTKFDSTNLNKNEDQKDTATPQIIKILKNKKMQRFIDKNQVFSNFNPQLEYLKLPNPIFSNSLEKFNYAPQSSAVYQSQKSKEHNKVDLEESEKISVDQNGLQAHDISRLGGNVLRGRYHQSRQQKLQKSTHTNPQVIRSLNEKGTYNSHMSNNRVDILDQMTLQLGLNTEMHPKEKPLYDDISQVDSSQYADNERLIDRRNSRSVNHLNRKQMEGLKELKINVQNTYAEGQQIQSATVKQEVDKLKKLQLHKLNLDQSQLGGIKASRQDLDKFHIHNKNKKQSFNESDYLELNKKLFINNVDSPVNIYSRNAGRSYGDIVKFQTAQQLKHKLTQILNKSQEEDNTRNIRVMSPSTLESIRKIKKVQNQRKLLSNLKNSQRNNLNETINKNNQKENEQLKIQKQKSKKEIMDCFKNFQFNQTENINQQVIIEKKQELFVSNQNTYGMKLDHDIQLQKDQTLKSQESHSILSNTIKSPNQCESKDNSSSFISIRSRVLSSRRQTEQMIQLPISKNDLIKDHQIIQTYRETTNKGLEQFKKNRLGGLRLQSRNGIKMTHNQTSRDVKSKKESVNILSQSQNNFKKQLNFQLSKLPIQNQLKNNNRSTNNQNQQFMMKSSRNQDQSTTQDLHLLSSSRQQHLLNNTVSGLINHTLGTISKEESKEALLQESNILMLNTSREDIFQNEGGSESTPEASNYQSKNNNSKEKGQEQQQRFTFNINDGTKLANEIKSKLMSSSKDPKESSSHNLTSSISGKSSKNDIMSSLSQSRKLRNFKIIKSSVNVNKMEIEQLQNSEFINQRHHQKSSFDLFEKVQFNKASIKNSFQGFDYSEKHETQDSQIGDQFKQIKKNLTIQSKRIIVPFNNMKQEPSPAASNYYELDFNSNTIKTSPVIANQLNKSNFVQNQITEQIFYNYIPKIQKKVCSGECLQKFDNQEKHLGNIYGQYFKFEVNISSKTQLDKESDQHKHHQDCSYHNEDQKDQVSQQDLEHHFNLMMQEFHQKVRINRIEILDGFYQQTKQQNIFKEGKSTIFMQTGFFRRVWLNQVNTELYIYPDEDSKSKIDLVILVPNVHFQKLESIEMTDNKVYHEFTKLYPLKIVFNSFNNTTNKKNQSKQSHLTLHQQYSANVAAYGTAIHSTNRASSYIKSSNRNQLLHPINSSSQQTSYPTGGGFGVDYPFINKDPSYILYFHSDQSRQQWYKSFVRVSGNYNIEESYQMIPMDRLINFQKIEFHNQPRPNDSKFNITPRKKNAIGPKTRKSDNELCFTDAAKQYSASTRIAGVKKNKFTNFDVEKLVQQQVNFQCIPSYKDKQSIVAVHKKTQSIAFIRMIRKQQQDYPLLNKIALSKQFEFDSANKLASIKEQMHSQVMQQVNIMRMLNHKNIVRLLDYFENQDYQYVCTEHIEGQSFQDYCFQLYDQNEDSFDENLFKNTYRQIVNALSYLHSMGVVLRNLSTRSIMMQYRLGDEMIPMISKLNRATIIYKFEETYGEFENVQYRAPEIHLGKPYGKKADSWAFGVMLFYVATGYYPFEGVFRSINSEQLSRSLRFFIKGNKGSVNRQNEKSNSNISSPDRSNRESSPKLKRDSHNRGSQKCGLRISGLKKCENFNSLSKSEEQMSQNEDWNVTCKFNIQDLKQKIKEKTSEIRGLGDSMISHQLQDLISKCLEFDPVKRLSMQAISKHQWFKDINYKQVIDAETTNTQMLSQNYKMTNQQKLLFSSVQQGLNNQPVQRNTQQNQSAMRLNQSFKQQKPCSNQSAGGIVRIKTLKSIRNNKKIYEQIQQLGIFGKK